LAVSYEADFDFFDGLGTVGEFCFPEGILVWGNDTRRGPRVVVVSCVNGVFVVPSRGEALAVENGIGSEAVFGGAAGWIF